MMSLRSLRFLLISLAGLALAACGSGGGGGGGGSDSSPLTANIAVASGETTIYAFDPLAFTGGATGGSGSYTYTWNFDSTEAGGGPAASSTQSPTAVFQNAGTYTVELTVSSGGSNATATYEVTVLPETDPDRVWYTIGSGAQTVATEAARTITATFDPRNSSTTAGGRADRTTVSLAATATEAGFSVALGAPSSQLPASHTAYSASAGPIFSATYTPDNAGTTFYVLHSGCSGSDSPTTSVKRYGRRIVGTFALKLYRYDPDGSLTGTPNSCVPTDNMTITGGFNAARAEVSIATAANMVALCAATTGDETDDFCYVEDNTVTAAASVTEDGDNTISVTYYPTGHDFADPFQTDIPVDTSVLTIVRSDESQIDITFSTDDTGTHSFAARTATAEFADADGEIWLTNDGASSGSKCGMARVLIDSYGAATEMVTGSFVLELFHYNATTHVVECSNRKVFYGSFEATREADGT